MNGGGTAAPLPDAPTTAEAGMPGFVAASRHAFIAPAAALAVVERLEAAVGQC
jgi:tripartite-type tricarboxylate transporter receptor subunit TctC